MIIFFTFVSAGLRRTNRNSTSNSASMKIKAKKKHGLSTKVTNKPSKARASACASSNSTPLTLLSTLNDDCILEIFSYLNIKDLCAIRDCSRRFHILADCTVHKRFRNKYVRLPAKENAADAASILIKFGKLFTQLQIDDENRFIRSCNQSTNALKFNSMITDCKSLKCLRLKNVCFGYVNSQKFKQILQNITTLELYNCMASNHVRELLESCKTLKHLTIAGKIHSITSDICFAIKNYGQFLESIRFRNCRHELSTIDFLNFIGDLNQLKNLNKIYVGRVRKSAIIPILIKLVKTNSHLETIGFNKFIPENNEFFESLKHTKLKKCILFTKDVISAAIAASATDFSITTTKCANKNYPYVITVRKK